MACDIEFVVNTDWTPTIGGAVWLGCAVAVFDDRYGREPRNDAAALRTRRSA